MTPGEMMCRDSFVFYRSFYNSIIRCPEDVQLTLFRAVGDYALNLVEPKFEAMDHGPFLEAIWGGIKPQLDANMRRYINGCKGGCPKGVRNNPNGRRGKGINQELTKNKPNENVNENENENVKNKEALKMPFESLEFLQTWNELVQQPKWRGKTRTALQKNLDRLSKFDEQFAIELMNTAIANGWQGLVFQDTEKKYLQRSNQGTEAKPARKPITSLTELMRDEQR